VKEFILSNPFVFACIVLEMFGTAWYVSKGQPWSGLLWFLYGIAGLVLMKISISGG